MEFLNSRERFIFFAVTKVKMKLLVKMESIVLCVSFIHTQYTHRIKYLEKYYDEIQRCEIQTILGLYKLKRALKAKNVASLYTIFKELGIISNRVRK